MRDEVKHTRHKKKRGKSSGHHLRAYNISEYVAARQAYQCLCSGVSTQLLGNKLASSRETSKKKKSEKKSGKASERKKKKRTHMHAYV